MEFYMVYMEAIQGEAEGHRQDCAEVRDTMLWVGF